MSLQMILGKAGSGKSTFLYEKIISEAEKNKEQTYLVLVPEQFTLSTQQEFVQRTKNHCIMNIDVLSFERLAYRVFDELGISELTVLEDIEKTLIIRKVAGEKERELRILRKNIDKPGYLDQVKSLLTEFAQYHVTVEQMKAVLEQMPQSMLYYKMNDLMLLYEGMEEFIKERYITAEKLLLMLAEVAPKSKLLKNAVIAFDGYTGFTPVQTIFLEKLMPLVQKLYVTVLIDPKEEWMNVGPIHELFYLSKKYVATLNRIAKKSDTSLEEPIIMPEPENARFKERKGLAFLEKNLFRTKVAGLSEKQDDIKVFRLENPRKELSYVASLIYRYVNQGMRYQEMAIVTADVDTYAGVIREVFDKANIPYFIDQKKKITFNAFVELLKGLLEMVQEDFSYESVFRYLKTGLSNLSWDEIELLENYCLSGRIKGYKKYSLPFSYCVRGYTQEELDKINVIRQKFMEPIDTWCQCAMKKGMVKDYVEGLCQCMELLQLEERMKEISIRLEEEGQRQRSKEYGQIFGLVQELLKKYMDLMGEERLSLDEFREILEAGLDATKVSTIPAGRDCIILGDIERTRLEHIKVLFFVGVNEGIIPRISTGSMCLTQVEREALLEQKMELAAGPKERIFIQQFYLYMVMAKPKEKLIITYAENSMSGEGMKPSYLIGNLQELFKDLVITKGDDLTYEEENFCEGLAFSNMVEHIQEDDVCESIAYFSQNENYSEQMALLYEAAANERTPEHLEKELLEKLYGKEMTGSVTRLECQARCGMQHFLSYGLKLQERNTGKFTMMDMGTIFHAAMEEYSKQLKEQGYTYANVPTQKREQLAQMAVRNVVSDLNQIYLYETARNAYQVERLSRIVKRSAWAMGKQMEYSGFEPISFEKKFHLKAGQENMLTFSNGFSMDITGKIDRIDGKRTQDKFLYRVIDYKSGNTKLDIGQIYDGTQLQLMTYESAAKELLKREYGEDIQCEGAFYYSMKDPFVKEKPGMSEDDIESALYDELRLDGASIEEEDESTTKKSKDYGKETMDLLETYTRYKIHELGEEIVSGEVITNPRYIGEILGCEYCLYQGCCGFDEKIDAKQIRENTKAKDEVMKAMKKVVTKEAKKAEEE